MVNLTLQAEPGCKWTGPPLCKALKCVLSILMQNSQVWDGTSTSLSWARITRGISHLGSFCECSKVVQNRALPKPCKTVHIRKSHILCEATSVDKKQNKHGGQPHGVRSLKTHKILPNFPGWQKHLLKTDLTLTSAQDQIYINAA